MKITEQKRLAYLNEFTNAIVFDKGGDIIESTFPDSAKINVFDLPFFAGIHESVLALSLNKKVTFECVHTTLFGKKSHYDLSLERIKYTHDSEAFLWCIYDFGRQYQKAFLLARSNGVAPSPPTNGSNGNSHFLIKTSDNLVNLNLHGILYFEAYGDYVKVHTEEKTYIHYNRMKNIDAKMPDATFMRVHRSFIVNLDKIQQIEKENIQVGDRWIPVSAANKSNLHARLNKF